MARTARQAKIDKQHRTVVLPLDLLQRLDPHAERRGVHRNQLVREIVEAAVEAGLVDAVLDDGPDDEQARRQVIEDACDRAFGKKE